MHASDLSNLTVSSIDMVVYMPSDTDTGFVPVGGMQIKQFGPRRYHGIVLKAEGANRYIVEGKYTLEAMPGHVLYLPQGRPYVVVADKPGACYCVNFHIAENLMPEPFTLPARNWGKWLESFGEMVSSWTYRRPGYRARCNALLYQMLAVMEEDRQAQYLPSYQIAAIRQIAQIMESSNVPSVEELAAQCGMSQTYFRRLFRELYGLPPKQYIQQARFRQAKALLESSDAPIAVIAESAGFESIYHFSRAFRTHEGISPSEYRKKQRGGA